MADATNGMQLLHVDGTVGLVERYFSDAVRPRQSLLLTQLNLELCQSILEQKHLPLQILFQPFELVYYVVEIVLFGQFTNLLLQIAQLIHTGVNVCEFQLYSLHSLQVGVVSQTVDHYLLNLLPLHFHLGELLGLQGLQIAVLHPDILDLLPRHL